MHQPLLLQTFHDHEGELLRFLTRRLGSRSLAADIAQDLYVKLLGSDQNPEVRDRKAYLFSMAANLATDHVRVERRRGEILVEADGILAPRANAVTPERHAIARAELAYMEASIAQLSPRCRRVFYLSRYEGRTQAEIAVALGLGITTVYKELKMAMEAMLKARKRFQGSGDDDFGHRK